MHVDRFLFVSFILFLTVAIVNLFLLATHHLWKSYEQTVLLVSLRLLIAASMAAWAFALLLESTL